MIGNAIEAAEALAGRMGYLGSGCYRRAYLNDDRSVVYKIQYFENSSGGNVREHMASQDLRTLPDIPEDLEIPETALYNINGQPVLAMPFVDGMPAHWSFPAHIREWFKSHKVHDVGHDNVLSIGSKFFLVDMEFTGA